MSEAVEILLSADDQASKEFTKVGDNLGAMSARATQVLAGMEETANDLHAELAALAEQHKAGSLTADQYAAAQTDVLDLLAKNVAETKAYNADLQKATSIVNAAKTSTEKYNEELSELGRLHKSGVLSTEQFTKLESNLKAKIDQASDSFKQQQSDAQKVASVLQSIKAPIDQYNEELAELTRLHKSGALSSDQFGKLEANLKTKIHQTSEAFRQQQFDIQKVKTVLESIKSPIDRYNDELEELTRLQKAGLLTSDQFAKAQANIGTRIQATGNAFKEMGGKAKAGTELFGTIANLSGGSQLGGFAGQLAGLTDKIGAFSEVSKAGGAGAMAFKGGLVAATGVIAFGIGKAIGDVVFETKRWADELENAKKKIIEIDNQMSELQQNRFSDAREDFSLIDDPAEREAAIKSQTELLKKQLGEEQNSVERLSASLEEANAIKKEGRNWFETPAEMNARITSRAAELAQAEKTKKATQDEIAELEKLTSQRAKEVEAIKTANATKLQWQQLVAEDQQKNIDERIKEAELANKEYEDELKNVEALKKAEEDRASKEKEAQAALNAKQSEDAARKLEQDQEAAEGLAERLGAATTNAASESRLLTRGPSQDKTVEVAANTAKANEILANLPSLIATALTPLVGKDKAKVIMELVS